MKTKIIAALALTACGVAGAAHATDRMYGIVTAGYSDMEFSQLERDNYNYSLAIGHQFSNQWYVEGGYLALIDDMNDDEGAKADALYLAVLGKAASREGELYYKLGVANVAVDGLEQPLDGACELGELSVGRCAYDESVAAGLVGIGFDYNIGLNAMVRMEAMYMIGEHDFTANVFSLGFRYNFN